jgi:hypothetical protein
MISNLLFYFKNLIFNWHNTPKEVRTFTCFMCQSKYIYPITSADYFVCNNCFDTI